MRAFAPTALEGKMTLVLGGTSGLGLGIARAARAAGSEVVVASRAPEKLKAMAPEFGFKTARADANVDEDVHRLFNEVGDVDHIVVTAGEGVVGPVAEHAFEELRPTLETKIRGAFNVARYGRSHIRTGGSITLVSGLAAWRPFVGGSTAAAANAGVEALGRVLALELKPIRVNTIVPGVIDTPLLDRVFGPGRAETVAAIAKGLPVGRIGTTEDVAHSVLFLLTNEFVTGSTLHVDGGALVV